MSRARKIEALERRRAWLESRIESYRPDGNPSYDKAEVVALTWALALIEAAGRLGVLDDLDAAVRHGVL